MSNSNEMCSNIKVECIDYNKLVLPILGDKRHLLDMSIRNIKNYKINFFKSSIKSENSFDRILKNLKKDLNMDNVPVHIECFDNSNTQRTNPVAACVVFKNARPSKKDYRHFNIKTVQGPDDFASMEEVVYRRYKRLLEEKKERSAFVS